MDNSEASLMLAPGSRVEAEKRAGDWMITFTGRRFWPLDPRPDEVSFLDIAHGLSLICRYGGHTGVFYSVAEHCAHLAMFFLEQQRPDLARYALLHDASEAYIGDIIRPVKPELPQFKAIEGPLERLVLQVVGLPSPMPKEVHQADADIIAVEARALFTPAVLARAGWVLPMRHMPGVDIMGWSPAYAKREFLVLFEHLFPGVAVS